MSALTPHLENYDDVSKLEADFYDCVSTAPEELSGNKRSCPSPQTVENSQHTIQLRTVYTRQAIDDALVNYAISVDMSNLSDIKLFVGKIEEGRFVPGVFSDIPAFNPIEKEGIGKSGFSLLSWTSKMNCPSFSLPAGAPSTGGACPGAVGGQSVVPETQRKKATDAIDKLYNIRAFRSTLAQTVCQACYAMGKGNYGYSSKILLQSIVYAWVKQAINMPSPVEGMSAFVFVMDHAIKNADYRLAAHSFRERGGEVWAVPAERTTHKRFFRIHDSGDFFSLTYLEQWKQLADLNPDVLFWAPTRVWAATAGERFNAKIAEINSGTSNLIIRPSAFYINQRCPVSAGDGYAAPSTVASDALPSHVAREIYDWQCRAYAGQHSSAKACRVAEAPPEAGGGMGCRACWTHPELRINYNPH